MTVRTPKQQSDRRSYASRSRRWLLAGSLVGLYLVSLTMLFEPDPETGLRPVANDYVWIVVPAAVLIVVLAWRALRVKVVTDPNGVDIVRVVGHEVVPWRALRQFEVHPTPGHAGYAVLARLNNERLVKVGTEIVVRPVMDRQAARALARLKADSLAQGLEADRLTRAAAGPQPTRA